jgi:membrane protease YdiL (CAAX protease family)
MMLGVLFGYLFYWSGSLWLPIWAHLINNGSVIIFAYLAQRGLFNGNYENFGSTDDLLVILFSVVISALVLLIIRKRL